MLHVYMYVHVIMLSCLGSSIGPSSTRLERGMSRVRVPPMAVQFFLRKPLDALAVYICISHALYFMYMLYVLYVYVEIQWLWAQIPSKAAPALSFQTLSALDVLQCDFSNTVCFGCTVYTCTVYCLPCFLFS